MDHQVVRVTAYEASTSVNLIVVKPETQIDVLDPSVWTVQTNGVDRVVKALYTCDDRGEWKDGGGNRNAGKGNGRIDENGNARF